MKLTKDKLIKTLLITTILALINLIVFIVLDSCKVIKVDIYRYLLIILHFFLIWIPLVFRLIFKRSFSLAVVIFYEVFTFLSLVVGSAWQVYEIGNIFDKIVHFTSGIFLTLLFFNVMYNKFNKSKLSLILLFFCIFSFAMMVGGMWEIYEFAVDGLLGLNMQRWEGFIGRTALIDTMSDLIIDALGAILAGLVVIILNYFNKKKQSL